MLSNRAFWAQRAPLALIAALLLLALPACDSGEEPVDPPPPAALLSGSYTGTANVGGLAVSIVLTLTENNNIVSGSGTLRGSDVLSLSASGTRVNNDFNLTLSSEGFSDLNFAGNISSGGAVMTGVLNGSGFDSVTITLNRTEPLRGDLPEAASVTPGDAPMLNVVR